MEPLWIHVHDGFFCKDSIGFDEFFAEFDSHVIEDDKDVDVSFWVVDVLGSRAEENKALDEVIEFFVHDFGEFARDVDVF